MAARCKRRTLESHLATRKLTAADEPLVCSNCERAADVNSRHAGALAFHVKQLFVRLVNPLPNE